MSFQQFLRYGHVGCSMDKISQTLVCIQKKCGSGTNFIKFGPLHHKSKSSVDPKELCWRLTHLMALEGELLLSHGSTGPSIHLLFPAAMMRKRKLLTHCWQQNVPNSSILECFFFLSFESATGVHENRQFRLDAGCTQQIIMSSNSCSAILVFFSRHCSWVLVFSG